MAQPTRIFTCTYSSAHPSYRCEGTLYQLPNQQDRGVVLIGVDIHATADGSLGPLQNPASSVLHLNGNFTVQIDAVTEVHRDLGNLNARAKLVFRVPEEQWRNARRVQFRYGVSWPDSEPIHINAGGASNSDVGRAAQPSLTVGRSSALAEIRGRFERQFGVALPQNEGDVAAFVQAMRAQVAARDGAGESAQRNNHGTPAPANPGNSAVESSSTSQPAPSSSGSQFPSSSSGPQPPPQSQAANHPAPASAAATAPPLGGPQPAPPAPDNDGMQTLDALMAEILHLSQTDPTVFERIRGVLHGEEVPHAGNAEAVAAPVENANRRCIICQEAEADATFIHGQTGHTCCCMPCAEQWQRRRGRNCPMCRQRFQTVVRNFSA